MTNLLHLSAKILFYRAKALAQLKRYEDALDSLKECLEHIAYFEEEFIETFHLLPSYTAAADQGQALYQLLTNINFIKDKAINCGVQSLIEDYERVKVLKSQLSQEQNEYLELIQGAIQMSAHILAEDRNQILGQLLGRLLHFEEVINVLFSQTKQTKAPLLYLLTATLIPPIRGLVKTLIGHNQDVIAIAITPDGKQLVSSSWDKTIKVWNLRTGQVLLTIETSLVNNALAVTPDGKKLISASTDIKIWHLQTGEELLTLTGHQKAVNSLAVTADGQYLISGSSDNTIKTWHLQTGQELLTLTGRSESINGEVRSVAVSPNGSQIISGSADGKIKVWDLKTGQELLTLTGHRERVNAVAVTPDGEKIISAADYDRSEKTTIKVWDADRGEELMSLRSLFPSLNDADAIAIAPNGQKLIVNSDDTLGIWDLRWDGSLIATLKGHTRNITSLAITPDEKWAISSSEDCTIKVWDLQNTQKLPPLPGHKSSVQLMTVTLDGKFAVSTGYKDIKFWDLQTGQELRNFPRETYEGAIISLLLMPDNERIIVVSKDEDFNIWNLHSGEKILTLFHQDDVRSVAITSDGKKAISTSIDKTLKIWDLQSGRELRTLNGHTDWVTDVAITPDDQQAVSVSSDKTLKVWDLVSGLELQTLNIDIEFPRNVAITPDGNKIIVSGHSIKVWDRKSGEELFAFPGYYNVGYLDVRVPIAITPDSQKLIATSDNKNLKVLDLQSGQELLTLSGHTNIINYFSLAPNGKYLVSVANDQSLKIWDLESGKIVASFNGDSELYCCAISPDGLNIVAGENSGRVHFLRFNPDESEILQASNFTPGQLRHAEQLFNQGLELYKSSQYEQAIPIFEQSLNLKLDLYQTWWYRGQALSKLDGVEAIVEAHQSFSQALDFISMGDADYDSILMRCIDAKYEIADRLYNRAVAKENLEDIQGAIQDLTIAIGINDKFAKAYSFRAYLQIEAGNYQAAIADCNKALELNKDADLSLTYFYRGNAYKALENYLAAITDYTQALQLDPNFANAYNNRATSRASLGDIQGSIADFTQAIQIDPQDAITYYNRGILLKKYGNKQGAIADFSSVIGINPNFQDAYENRGILRFELEDYEGTIEDLTRAIYLKSNSSKVYGVRGFARYELGDNDGAIEDFTQALRLNPTEAYIYYSRGITRANMGDILGSRSDFQKAAQLYLEQGDIEFYQKVIQALQQI